LLPPEAPSHPAFGGTVAKVARSQLELTAAGTVPDLHGIPSCYGIG